MVLTLPLAPLLLHAGGAPGQPAADVERQLAALSSKLGQLSLCLHSFSLQQQGSPAAPAHAAAEARQAPAASFLLPAGLFNQVWGGVAAPST